MSLTSCQESLSICFISSIIVALSHVVKHKNPHMGHMLKTDIHDIYKAL